MYKHLVYLDTKANRLIIVNKAIQNDNFVQLMNNNGPDEKELLDFCKAFCIGYIMGSDNKKPINDINEFA